MIALYLRSSNFDFTRVNDAATIQFLPAIHVTLYWSEDITRQIDHRREVGRHPLTLNPCHGCKRVRSHVPRFPDAPTAIRAGGHGIQPRYVTQHVSSTHNSPSSTDRQQANPLPSQYQASGQTKTQRRANRMTRTLLR